MESYDFAIADFERAIDLDHSKQDTYNMLTWLYATDQNTSYRNGEKAVEYPLMAILLHETPEYLDTLAAAYVETGEYENALKMYLRVNEKDQILFINHYQESLIEKGYLSKNININYPIMKNAIQQCVLDQTWIGLNQSQVQSVI